MEFIYEFQIGGFMNDLSLSPPQRRIEFDEWSAHCSAIIRSELKRRGISVRALLSAGVLRSRNGFAERLKATALRPKELSDLADYLDINLPHLMTAFLTSEPDASYNKTVFQNISLIYQALITEYEKLGLDILLDMERLRPAVARVLACRILELLRAHHERCEQARDAILLT
jgi:hypothetical protein